MTELKNTIKTETPAAPLGASSNPRSVWRPLAAVSAFVWLLLIITGIVQTFLYRPPNGGRQFSDRMSEFLSQVHVGAAWVALILPLVAVVVAIVQRVPRRAAFSGLGLVIVAVGLFSGGLLPWDQLALWSVTTGTSMIGFGPIFSDDVRFVLIDGSEVSLAFVRTWFLVHAVVVPVAAAALAALWYRRERS